MAVAHKRSLDPVPIQYDSTTESQAQKTKYIKLGLIGLACIVVYKIVKK